MPFILFQVPKYEFYVQVPGYFNDNFSSVESVLKNCWWSDLIRNRASDIPDSEVVEEYHRPGGLVIKQWGVRGKDGKGRSGIRSGDFGLGSEGK